MDGHLRRHLRLVRAGSESRAKTQSPVRRFGGLPRAWQDVAPIYGVTVIFALIYFYLTRETFGLRTVTNLSAYLFPPLPGGDGAIGRHADRRH